MRHYSACNGKRDHGLDVLVLEATDRPGGKAQTYLRRMFEALVADPKMLAAIAETARISPEEAKERYRPLS